MQYTSIRLAISLLWVTAVWLVGVRNASPSMPMWLGLASVAIVPPVLMQWFWRFPAQTMSESIREARR